MKAIGIFLAVLFHLAVILFGGLFLLTDKEKAARQEENMEMEVEEEKPEKPEEQKPEEKEEKEVEEEKPEAPPAPALAPSLADLEVALGGVGGDSSFGVGGALNSGGGIGGADGNGGAASDVLSASQLDQKPRLMRKVDPTPPAAIAKKLPQLTITVFIDAAGNVMKAEVAPAVEPAAMKPIMDAVMRWKYEPGMRNGQKVGCKVSHKINFQG